MSGSYRAPTATIGELGFNPLDLLRKRVVAGRSSVWLDLCCGTGKALIEAARIVHDVGLAPQIGIVGVDLVSMFHRPDPGLTCLRLVEASLSSWCPDRDFDLITCVLGLHYVGDKLLLIARAASWMVEDGVYVANLDLANVKVSDGATAGRAVIDDLERAALQYDRRKRRVVCRGRKAVDLPYRYLGADDQAGPNYTGQSAVDSYDSPVPRR